MTIDVGTGDGRAVLAAASREPATLAIGIDASAAAMAESSRRAARSTRKGGLPNARFVLASAEAPPVELAGSAQLVSVLFPWGSLLRGCVGADRAVTDGVAGLVGPGGTVVLMLAPADRDGLDGVPTEPAELVQAVQEAFEAPGLGLMEARTATPADVADSGSTWARRLGATGSRGREARTTTFIRLGRQPEPTGR